MEVSNRSLFWDTNVAQIDRDKNADFVIGRVLKFGDEADWRWLKGLYNIDAIKQQVLNQKKLDKKSLNFWKLILNLN